MTKSIMIRFGRVGQLAACMLAVAGGVALSDPTPAVSTLERVAQINRLSAGTPCTVAARACVDLARNSMWLVADGQIVRGPMPIKRGAPGRAVVGGVSSVQWKAKYHLHPGSRSPMSWAVFFGQGDVAFTMIATSPATAETIGLGESDARALYDKLRLGDRIEIR